MRLGSADSKLATDSAFFPLGGSAASQGDLLP